MDVQLVEKITRMVIAKLNEVNKSEGFITDELSYAEIKEWEQISNKVNVFQKQKVRRQLYESTPLSTEEIEEWEKISSQLKIKHESAQSITKGKEPDSPSIIFRSYN